MRRVGIGAETEKTMEQELDALKAENKSLKVEAEAEAKQKK